MKLFKKIAEMFYTKHYPNENSILCPAEISLRQFCKFNAEQRMISVMKTGDSGEVKYYDFIKWCIEFDADKNVRFAALKRLSNFNMQDDIANFLQHLDQLSNKSSLEPYLSMALSKAGQINEAELRRRLNNG